MPEYTIKEFALEVGKEPKHIHTYISRNKLVKNASRKIDTTIDINREFYNKYKINDISKNVNGNSRSKTKEKKSHHVELKDPEVEKYASISREKSRVELEIKKRDLEVKELELAKKRGDLVDLEKTGSLISEYVSSTNNKLCEALKIMIQDICARHSIEPGKAGEYKIKVTELINKINSESVDEVFRKIK
jgi:hypothetical protein